MKPVSTKNAPVREAKITITALLCLFAAAGASSARQLNGHYHTSYLSRQRPVLKTYPCYPKRYPPARLTSPFETEWDVEKWEKALRTSADKNYSTFHCRPALAQPSALNTRLVTCGDEMAPLE